MNLRDLKKDIEYLVGEFIDDCSLFIAFNPSKAGDEKLAKLIDEAVDLNNSLKDKVNARIDVKGLDKKKAAAARKAHFDSIRKELAEGLDNLCEKLSAEVAK